jgi:hypothetical protein
MSSYDDGAFRIELRWKEEVRYWEGNRGVVFPAGWGVKPPVLYVPLRSWDESVSSWLRGRRDEVVERLRRHREHTVEETDDGFGPAAPLQELAPVPEGEEKAVVVLRATGEVRIPTPSLSLDDFLAELGSGR